MMADHVVLAPKFLAELRMLPESTLSSSAALVDSVLGMYSGVDILLKGHLSADVCRGQLTRNLRKSCHSLSPCLYRAEQVNTANLLPNMTEELALAMSEYFSEGRGGSK